MLPSTLKGPLVTGVVLSVNLLILLAVSWSGFITSILEPHATALSSADAVDNVDAVPDLLWSAPESCVIPLLNNQQLLQLVECALVYASNASQSTDPLTDVDCSSTVQIATLRAAVPPLPADLVLTARVGESHVLSFSSSTASLMITSVNPATALAVSVSTQKTACVDTSNQPVVPAMGFHAVAESVSLPVAAVVVTVLFCALATVGLVSLLDTMQSSRSDRHGDGADVTQSVDLSEDHSRPRTKVSGPSSRKPRNQRNFTEGASQRDESEFSFDRPSVANADDVYMTCEMVEYDEASVVGVRIAEPIHALTGKDNERAVRFIDGLTALLIESRRTDNVVCALTPFFHFGAVFYGRNHAHTAALAALRLRGFVDASRENAFKTTVTVESGKVVTSSSGHFVQERGAMGPVVDECERVARLHPILTANKGLLAGSSVAARCAAPTSKVAFLAVDCISDVHAPHTALDTLGAASDNSLITVSAPDDSTVTVPMVVNVSTTSPAVLLPGMVADESPHAVADPLPPGATSITRSRKWLYSPCPCAGTPATFGGLQNATMHMLEALSQWNAQAALQAAADIEEAVANLDASSPVDAMGIDMFSLRRLIIAANAMEDASRSTLLGDTNNRSTVDHLPRVYVGWQSFGKESRQQKEWSKVLAGISTTSLHKSASSTGATSRSDTATLMMGASRDQLASFDLATQSIASSRNDADWLEAELETLLRRKQEKLDALIAKQRANAEEPKPLPGLFSMIDDDEDDVKEDQPAAAAAADNPEEDGGGFCLFSFVPVADKAPEDVVDDEDEAKGEPKRFSDRLGREWRLSSTMLGSGTFGNVYLGLGQDGSLVAVKCIPVSLKSKDECRNVVKEIRLLLRLKSERMVQYIASTVISNYLVIVMEAVGGGSLMGILQQYPSLPTTMIITYLRDILVGLRYLHSHGVVHRDIKPHNILMTQQGRCKLADFGAACHVGFATASEKSGDIAGTIVYMAPESCAGELHVRSDLWSLGIMAFQLVTKSLPYHPADLNLPHAILHKLSKRDPALFRPDVSAAPTWIRGFIDRCLEFDPDLRPAADDLVRHSALVQSNGNAVNTAVVPQRRL